MNLSPKTQAIESLPSLRFEEELVEVCHLELIGEVNLVNRSVLIEGSSLTFGEVSLREGMVFANFGFHETRVVRLNVGEGRCG